MQADPNDAGVKFRDVEADFNVLNKFMSDWFAGNAQWDPASEAMPFVRPDNR